MKENDLIFNMLDNPDANIAVLKEVGLNADNTSLQDKDKYIKSKHIYENPIFFNENGEFDDKKFDGFYDNAKVVYNLLSNDNYEENILDNAIWHRENIFAPKEGKRDIHKFDTEEVWVANPYRLYNSVERFGQKGKQKLTEREISESQKVLLNPTGVSNGEEPEWGDSMENSFWTNLVTTNVVASWDFDADENGNPTDDPAKIVYKKGERKLNENGTFYAERLDGRDIYGKEVISKFDTLTTEGTAWNKYDFFDSDDLKSKHWFGTLMRESVLVAPMFIPYVGQAWAGLYVANELGRTLGVVGKMLSNNDSKFANSLEGYLSSWKTSTTKESQENFFTLENILKLSGDITSQLATQRFIFEYAPSIFKGTKFLDAKGGLSTEKMANLQKELAEEYINSNSFKHLTTGTMKDMLVAKRNLISSSQAYAATKVNNMLKSYTDLGETLSRAYMTAIVTSDMYNEAINSGATNAEASLLTLGYASAEYTLLKSNLGSWILPEVRASKNEINKLVKDVSKLINSTDIKDKASNIKKALKIGYNAAKGDYLAGVGNSLKSAGIGALNEGLEEVSEELLADFSRGLFNVSRELRGENSILKPFENVQERYIMSFFGGALGGAVMGANLKFKGNIPNSESAVQKLVYAVKNGEYDNIKRVINDKKFIPASKNLSINPTIDKDGNVTFDEVKDGELSQNDAVKAMLNNYVDTIKTVLEDNSLEKSETELVRSAINADEALRDIKAETLLKTSSLGLLFQGYNSLGVKAVEVANKIKDLNVAENKEKLIKSGKDPEEELQKLKSELELIKNEANSYINGNKNKETIRNILFETMTSVSKDFLVHDFKSFVKLNTGRDYRSLNEEELNEQANNFEAYKNGDFKDKINSISKNYVDFIQEFSNDETLKELLNSDSVYDLNAAAIVENINVDELLPIYISRANNPNYVPNLNFNPFTFDEDETYDYLDSVIQNIKNENNPIVRKIAYDNFVKKLKSKVKDLESSGQNDISYSIADYLSTSNSLFTEKDTVDYKLSKLINRITELLYGETLDFDDLVKPIITSRDVQDEITYDDNEIEKIKMLSQAMKFLQSILEASKIDNSTISGKPFGFNSIINRLNGSNLLEINSKKANLLTAITNERIAELGKIIELNEYNSGQKSIVQQKITVNKHLLMFKRMKQFFSNIDENKFKGVSKIKLLIEKSENLQKLSDENKLDISEEELILLEKEIVEIDEQINKIYEENDFNNNDELLGEFLKSINIFDNTFEELTEKSTKIDEQVFLSHLTSRGALSSKEFLYKLYSIMPENVMPLATHESAIYNNYAMFINRQLFNRSIKAVRKNSIDKVNEQYNLLKNGSDEEKKSSKEWFKNASNISGSVMLDVNSSAFNDVFVHNLIGSIETLPFYENITLTEGVSGSGKTSIVISLTIGMIKKYNPEFANNLKIAHITKSLGEKLVEDIKTLLPDTKDIEIVVKDKNSLMEDITGKRVPFVDSEGNLVKDVKIKYPNKNKNNLITDERITYSDININNEPADFNILVIDEVSRYSTLDMDAIMEYAKKHNIVVFVAGDFEQTSVVSIINSDHISKDSSINLQLTKNSFIRTSKFGTSMRTRNSQKNKNNKAAQIFSMSSTKNITLYNYKNNDMIAGDFIYPYPIKDKDNPDIIKMNSDAKSIINKMVDNIDKNSDGTNEKIGVIIYDSNSKVLKYLKNTYPNFDELFTIYFKDDAQGSESKYYIIDFQNNQSSNEIKRKQLYTNISRSKEASLTFYDDRAFNIQTVNENITKLERLDPKSIKSFYDKKKRVVESVLENYELTETSVVIPNTEINDKTLNETTNVNEISNENDNVETINDNEIINNDENTINKEVETEEIIEENEIEINKVIVDNNDKNDEPLEKFWGYTMNTFGLGIIDHGDYITLPINYNLRSDGIIPFLKKMNPDYNETTKISKKDYEVALKSYIAFMTTFREKYRSKDLSKLLNALKSHDSNIDSAEIVISKKFLAQEATKNGNSRGKNESSYNNRDSSGSIVIEVLFKDNNSKVLYSVPVFTFPNFITLVKSLLYRNELEKINLKIDDFNNIVDEKGNHLGINEVTEMLLNNPNTNPFIHRLITVFKSFTFDKKLSDTLLQEIEFTSPFLYNNGGIYNENPNFKEVERTIYKDLKKRYDLNISPVKLAKTDIINDSGEVVISKGEYYISVVDKSVDPLYNNPGVKDAKIIKMLPPLSYPDKKELSLFYSEPKDIYSVIKVMNLLIKSENIRNYSSVLQNIYNIYIKKSPDMEMSYVSFLYGDEYYVKVMLNEFIKLINDDDNFLDIVYNEMLKNPSLAFYKNPTSYLNGTVKGKTDNFSFMGSLESSRVLLTESQAFEILNEVKIKNEVKSKNDKDITFENGKVNITSQKGIQSYKAKKIFLNPDNTDFKNDNLISAVIVYEDNSLGTIRFEKDEIYITKHNVYDSNYSDFNSIKLAIENENVLKTAEVEKTNTIDYFKEINNFYNGNINNDSIIHKSLLEILKYDPNCKSISAIKTKYNYNKNNFGKKMFENLMNNVNPDYKDNIKDIIDSLIDDNNNCKTKHK